jgi:hypothetical protein
MEEIHEMYSAIVPAYRHICLCGLSLPQLPARRGHKGSKNLTTAFNCMMNSSSDLTLTDENCVLSDIWLKLASWGVFRSIKQQIEEEERGKEKGLKSLNGWP